MVLEAHGPGGRARTADRDGFTLNMGAHALYRRGEGAKVLASLGIIPEGAPPPLAHYRALSGGRLHALPTGPASLVRTGALGARSKAQLAGSSASCPGLRPETADRDLGGRMAGRNQLRPDAEAVVRALLRLSTYTDDVDHFSADAAVGPAAGGRQGGVLYLHGGWSQLTGPGRSLDIRTGVKVEGVDQVGGGVEVRTAEGTVMAPRVVVATGSPAAVRRLLPVDPGWDELGPPVTAACLDLGRRRVPEPGLRPLPRRSALRHRPVAAGAPGPRGSGRGGRHPLRGPDRG